MTSTNDKTSSEVDDSANTVEKTITNDNKQREQKLRYEASEFDMLSGYDAYSNIDPYAHPLGVSTRPEYVPPAEIPPKVTQTTNSTIAAANAPYPPDPMLPAQMYPQKYAMTQVPKTHMVQMQPLYGQNTRKRVLQEYSHFGPSSMHPRTTDISMNINEGQNPLIYNQTQQSLLAQNPNGVVSSSGRKGIKMGQGSRNGLNRAMSPTDGHNLNGTREYNHMHVVSPINGQTEETLTNMGWGETAVLNSGATGSRYGPMVGSRTVSNGGRYDTHIPVQKGEYNMNGHPQHNFEKDTQEHPFPGQAVYPPMRGGKFPPKQSQQLLGMQPGHLPLQSHIPIQQPYDSPPGYEHINPYQPYSEGGENILTSRMPPMKDNADLWPPYENWKLPNYYTQKVGYETSHVTLPSNMIPPNPAVPVNTTMPQSGHKSLSRNFGTPKPEDIDPEFTNTPDLVRYQHWELLESAMRWLPGEGTVITWKGFRYVLGAPIHMGMNGHIHFCYRYKLPASESESSNAEKPELTNNTSKSSENAIHSDVNGEIPSSKDENGHTKDGSKNGTPNASQPYKLTKKDVSLVAAKIVPNTSAFAREIVILRDLQGCENITTLYDVLESKRTLISILELAQADVHHFFVGSEAIRHGWSLDKLAVREAFARMVMTNAVQGLKQMHEKGYLHCDLKSLNMLLYIYRNKHSKRQGGLYIKAKLTDFGHSFKGKQRIAEAAFRNGMARMGTAGHVAPELFKEGTVCDHKIDIWSLGIVMFSMLVPGKLLFGEYTNLESLKKAYDALNQMNPWSNQRRPKWWTDFERLSPEARDLILWMTRFNPEERPTEDQIMRHPWFQITLGIFKPGQYRPKLKYVDMLCSSSVAQE